MNQQLKIYWEWRYVENGIETPDASNRWLIRGNLKINCSDLTSYEWLKHSFATIALITMKGTANATFVNHPELPKYNVRVNNVLERSSLFNTGFGDTTQFFDTIQGCKKFTQRTMNFHLNMLKRAEKITPK